MVPGPKIPWAAWRKPTANRCPFSCCPWVTRGGSRTSIRISIPSPACARLQNRPSRSLRQPRLRTFSGEPFRACAMGAAVPRWSKFPLTCSRKKYRGRSCTSRRSPRATGPILPMCAKPPPHWSKRIILSSTRGREFTYARAWEPLKRLAELLGAPVATSLQGKSAFPEDHPLSLGSGGLAFPPTIPHFLEKADWIFGAGCSFTRDRVWHRHAEGQEVHSRHARSEPPEQGRSRGHRPDRRRAIDARRAMRRSRAAGQAAAGFVGMPRRNRDHPQDMARRMDAQAHLARNAAFAVSRALGFAAHGRRREYDHHARRRQPARSARARSG